MGPVSAFDTLAAGGGPWLPVDAIARYASICMGNRGADGVPIPGDARLETCYESDIAPDWGIAGGTAAVPGSRFAKTGRRPLGSPLPFSALEAMAAGTVGLVEGLLIVAASIGGIASLRLCNEGLGLATLDALV